MRYSQITVLLCLALLPARARGALQEPSGPVAISGELCKWHKITLTLEGPATAETATPNPFTDFRLEATFTNGGRKLVVPGYYAADGDAAQTGAAAGNRWRVHLAPDATGRWSYAISFRRGAGVATGSPGSGEPLAPLDGLTGWFDVGPSEKSGRDNRARGRLRYCGERYLRWAETGEPFLKQGADSPENLLAFSDFDGAFARDGHGDDLVKTWAAHVRDWRPGDPTWREGRGKGLIGAINYLAFRGMNSFSFLTLNIAGDDRNVFPYTSYDERERFDVSRLDQWELVFEHADRMGMYLHFKTQETENETLLDGGALGPQRRLYYRELIARFGHHLALNWNLGEENGWGGGGAGDQTTPQRIAMARYFHEVDPYHHPIVIHNGRMPDDLLGADSELTGFSLQTGRRDFRDVHRQVVTWVRRSAQAGRPWVVACDEPGDAQHALIPDAEDLRHDDARVNGLWGCLLGGGAGNEWYFGYEHPHSDLTCQDWRTRQRWWDQCRIALDFFREYLPFDRMAPRDDLIAKGAGFCLSAPGKIHAILVRPAAALSLDLGESATRYGIFWFDPRSGGALQPGTRASVRGPGVQSIGLPPRDAGQVWIALVDARAGSVRFSQHRPPRGAVVLFAGGGRADTSRWQQARVEGGYLREGALTRESYRDFHLHLEFRIGTLERFPRARGTWSGNSGVYLQQRYEVQILDSYGKPPRAGGCGGIYRQRAPDVNASLPAGRWQYYDIEFRAPRWNSKGEKVENARISVIHNGRLIHDDVQVPAKTGVGQPEGPEPRPIYLQDHGNPMEFRNVWVLER